MSEKVTTPHNKILSSRPRFHKNHGWFLTLGLVATAIASPPPAQAGLFEDALTESEEDTKAEKKSTGTVLGGIDFELNGFVRGSLFCGKTPEKDQAEVKSAFGEAALKLRARRGDQGDAYGEIRWRTGNLSGEKTSLIDLREAYVNAYLGPFDIRLGHQIISWGRADGTNPTDNLTPMDMAVRSADEDDRRRANFALRTFLNLNPLRFEAVWVPFYLSSQFPPFQIEGPITLSQGKDPALRLDNGTGAVRMHIETSAFDASVSYLIGRSTFPGIKLVTQIPDLLTSSEINLAFESYRHQVIGADFSLSVSDWFGLRGEFAFRDPLDSAQQEWVPLSDLQYVIGIDRDFFDHFSIILQYYGRYALDYTTLERFNMDDPLENDLTRIPELVSDEFRFRNRIINRQTKQVQHSATCRIEWRLLQETLRIELLAMANLSTSEWLLRPKVRYDLADAFSLYAGVAVSALRKRSSRFSPTMSAMEKRFVWPARRLNEPEP